jgi:restriction system protein
VAIINQNQESMSTKRLFYKDFQQYDHAETDFEYDTVGTKVMNSFENEICPNCSNKFSSFHNNKYGIIKINEELYDGKDILLFCSKCGWWQTRYEFYMKEFISNYAYQHHSILESIDISDGNINLNDLKLHLINNWDDRRFIEAGKAEELVRDILKEHLSCDVFYTTSHVNMPDGGIDLFVCHENGNIKTAIQVKRRKNMEPESISEVRNFLGAMIIEGYQNGIFVTTAERFTKNVHEAVNKLKFSQSNLNLNLIDGNNLLEIIHATSSTSSSRLPMGITLETVWNDMTKTQFTTEEIFYKHKNYSH